jgi:hypothetical protein
MSQALTARQQAAVDRINAQGNTAGIDKGMIQALVRKGALPGTTPIQAQEAQAKSLSKVAEDRAEANVLPDYTTRQWNSLCDLRDRIRQDGMEEIVSFNGWQLVTDKRSFGIVSDVLVVRD